jgi:hypothetical protein
MIKRESLSAIGVSLGLHLLAIVVLATIKYNVDQGNLQMVLDSVFTEERVQEEFEQEVDQNTDVAETMNFIAGSVAQNAANASGGTGPVVDQRKVDDTESLKEPDFTFKPGPITVPGLNILSNDLGSGQVTGDVGRVVEGYGTALGQITQELIRMMREEKLLCCWLFDASESMEDDRREIRNNFHKVYEELGLATKSDEKLKLTDEPIITSIFSFNSVPVEYTQKPTTDVAAIRAAIDKIVKDEGGEERFVGAVAQVIQKYGKLANSQKRKLVIIMVSDESGDDGETIEEAIDRCKRQQTPVYFLGRYATFGYPYARMRWIDPKTSLHHWLDIKRGPETPAPENLQHDGLSRRYDAYSSGFGPYEQVRLCRESGGIFFLLPGEEENLIGAGAHEQRKFDLLDMKEYLPDLSPRVAYVRERDSSKFRAGMWQIVSKLNPHQDQELNLSRWWLPMDANEFARVKAENEVRGVRLLVLFNEAHRFLETLKPLREREHSQRWRAHYDLMSAQALAYRVRVFQYLLAMDQHLKNKPAPKDPKNNRWDVRHSQSLLPPDKQQEKIAKVSWEELEQEKAKAIAGFQQVMQSHPRTPWAKLAEAELAKGFGIELHDVFRDPRYDTERVKLPNP